MRILLGVLLVVVALSMLIYLIPGGPGVGGGASGQNTVAVVGGEQITNQDVQRAIARITRNQANLPKALLAMYVPSVVNQLIEAKAMAYKARQLGLRVSDEELGSTIQSEFASELGGKFDMSIYQSVLEQQGMTVPDFEKERRDAMLGMRLEAMESQALVVSDHDAKAEYQRRNLKVGLQYVDFTDKDFASKVSKDPALVKAYFEKNRSLFRSPEKRDVSLIVGTTADFLQTANVSDQQLQQEYRNDIDSYRIPDRVRVRHILIKTQGKPKDQDPALKAKAEDILKQIQHGGNFAELAKKNSDDPGSGAKGGELGWIVRGQTVPNFEKTAFSLQPGQLSGLVETEYGYHIIQVEEKQAGHTQTFEEVKPQLLADMQKQAASDSLRRSVDSAREQIVKTPGQADVIAKKYNLKVFKVDNFASNGSLPNFSSPEIVNAIFSAPKGGVTDVTNLDAQGKAAFAVVTSIQPAHNDEYADVQADALQKYTEAESSRLAQEAAKTAADRAKKGESLEAIAKSYGLAVKTAAPFTIEGAAEGIGAGSILQDAFKANVGDVVGPVAAQNGQFVCKVSEKIPADMSQFAKNKDGVVQT
ncbi:MAG: peptidylprolyl isomerase, partial [Acidobacteriota bacterium]|nr:peptidylprolyl isomerase [Acidobacteriota bacterium]